MPLSALAPVLVVVMPDSRPKEHMPVLLWLLRKCSCFKARIIDELLGAVLHPSAHRRRAAGTETRVALALFRKPSPRS